MFQNKICFKLIYKDWLVWVGKANVAQTRLSQIHNMRITLVPIKKEKKEKKGKKKIGWVSQRTLLISFMKIKYRFCSFVWMWYFKGSIFERVESV